MSVLTAPWRRGLRIAAEFALSFGALFLVDRMTTGGTAFAGIHPNPYWLPVIVMALAYGTEAGLCAAMAASWIWLAHASGIVPSGDYLDRLLHLSLTPLLWFLVAALIGEVTILRSRRNARLAREADVAERNVERLSHAYQQLTATNRALQVRIAADAGTTGRIVALAAALTKTDAAQRRQAIGELIATAAGSSDFTAYRMDRDGAVRVWLRGTIVAPRPDILPMPLIARLRRDARTVTVARAADRVVLEDIGVAAVPLVGQGAMVGCLIMHSLPFEALNTQSIAELTEIGTWLPPLVDSDTSPAHAQAQRIGRG